ncbi:hypothetical protein BKA69DRAFT_1091393, partial [Paraphysoderma sedebokerense]
MEERLRLLKSTVAKQKLQLTKSRAPSGDRSGFESSANSIWRSGVKGSLSKHAEDVLKGGKSSLKISQSKSMTDVHSVPNLTPNPVQVKATWRVQTPIAAVLESGSMNSRQTASEQRAKIAVPPSTTESGPPQTEHIKRRTSYQSVHSFSSADPLSHANGQSANQSPNTSNGLLAGEYDEAASRKLFSEALQEWRTSRKQKGTVQSIELQDRDELASSCNKRPFTSPSTTLLDGHYDESKSHQDFVQALEEWRRHRRSNGDGQGPAEPRPNSANVVIQFHKGSNLSYIERLLLKQNRESSSPTTNQTEVVDLCSSNAGKEKSKLDEAGYQESVTVIVEEIEDSEDD